MCFYYFKKFLLFVILWKYVSLERKKIVKYIYINSK